MFSMFILAPGQGLPIHVFSFTMASYTEKLFIFIMVEVANKSYDALEFFR